MFDDQYPPEDDQQDLASGEPQPEQPDFASLPVDYGIPWQRDRRDRFARRFCVQMADYYAATARRRANAEKWVRDWECMPEDIMGTQTGGDGPYVDSSDVPSEATRRACNAHHSRLNQQILLLDPPFAVVARTDAAIAAVPAIEDALPAFLNEAEWMVHGDDLHQELPKIGGAFMSLTYEIQYRPKPWFQGTYDDDYAKALVQAGADPHEAAFEGLHKDEQGRVKRKLQFRQGVVKQGLVLKMIPWVDGWVLPATARNMDQAYGIGERLMISGADLKRGVKEGKYLEDEVDELLRRQSDKIDEDQNQRLQSQGIDPANVTSSTAITGEDEDEAQLYRQYLCHEGCYLIDGNEDGYLEWCWVTVHVPTQKLLRVQYLPWEHGEAHYHYFPFIRRASDLWGCGIAELGAALQDADSAVLNQNIDAANLRNNLSGNFMYDDSADFDPDHHELELGTPLKVGNLNGVKFMDVPSTPAEQYRMMDNIKQRFDLLTGASDPALGKEAAGQHTLGEMQIVVSQGNLLFENIAATVARKWKDLWDQSRFLIAQYGEGEDISYRRSARAASRIQIDQATGQVMPGLAPDQQGPFGTITSEILRAEVELVPSALQHMSDTQSRIQVAQITYNTVMQFPLVQSNPRIMIMVLDYYLQQMRVPIRKPLIQELEQGVAMQAAQQQMMMEAQARAQAQEQQQQQGQLSAQTTGAEHALLAQMAQHGMLPPAGQGGRPAAGPSMMGGNGAGPPPPGAVPVAGAT